MFTFMSATSTSRATFELLTSPPIKSQADSTKHPLDWSYKARLDSVVLEIRHMVSHGQLWQENRCLLRLTTFHKILELNHIKSDLSTSADSTYTFALFY